MIDVDKQIEEAIDALVLAAFAEGGCSEHRTSEARIQTELRKKELRTLLSSAQSGEQWEYPELPTGSEACEFTSYATVYDADDMRAYVDADRKRRAAGKPNVEMKHD